MPLLEMEFEVFCGSCGAGICGNCTEGTTKGRGMPYISVDPCQDCLDKAKEEGKDEGYDEGYEKALEENE